MNFDMITDEQLRILCKSLCTEEEYPIIEAAKIELEEREKLGKKIIATGIVEYSPKIRIRRLIIDRILLIRKKYYPDDNSAGGRNKKNKMSIPNNSKKD